VVGFAVYKKEWISEPQKRGKHLNEMKEYKENSEHMQDIQITVELREKVTKHKPHREIEN
jgi:hypothetical protein